MNMIWTLYIKISRIFCFWHWFWSWHKNPSICDASYQINLQLSEWKLSKLTTQEFDLGNQLSNNANPTILMLLPLLVILQQFSPLTNSANPHERLLLNSSRSSWLASRLMRYFFMNNLHLRMSHRVRSFLLVIYFKPTFWLGKNKLPTNYLILLRSLLTTS